MEGREGGTISNLNAWADGAPALILDPGYNVLMKAEENLKLAAYFICHQERVSLPVNVEAVLPKVVHRV